MNEEIVDILTRNGFEGFYAMLLYTVLRPLGFLFGFLPISWGVGQAVLLRMSIALALGLPMFVVNAPGVEEIIQATLPLLSALAAVKEFGVGYGIGFLASLPFFALQYAGAITDSFRGESDGGQTDPTGGTLQTFSVLYLVIGFSVFFSMGGLWDLVGLLYATYGVWPVSGALPAFTMEAGLVMVDLLQITLVTAIQISIPLLALLVTIEIAISVAARLARKFGFYDMAFPIKNTAAILTLPIVAWFVSSFSETSVVDLSILQNMFEAIIE
ncbi:EscT/YscT/HrcT family type III secretion system export apparatus protein [Aestuariibius insulae]|uniref:EscT/YscT/HrcT family type III secretion system export apparatus protein n=1 Tax=Aestuariibius insulae TaxID=2058287 RepID=UPI00345ED91F